MNLPALMPDAERAVALVAAGLFLVSLIYAAARALRGNHIPNALVITQIAGWAVLSPLAGHPASVMAANIGAAAMVFFATVAAFALGWIGSGDSKMLSVSALWLGAAQILPFLVATLLAGGAFALGAAALRLFPLPQSLTGPAPTGEARSPRGELPYAIAIVCGVLTLLPRTSWLAFQ